MGPDRSGKIPSIEEARKTIDVNTTATINFINQFLPLLSEKGRVVAVSSVMGQLNALPEILQDKLNNPSITEHEIIQLGE